MAAVLSIMDKVRTSITGVVQHTGPKEDVKHGPLLPVGYSKFTCSDMVTIGYISDEGTIRDMFALDAGTHFLMCPSDVHVVVDCAPKSKWSVAWPSPFNPFDPTRVNASLVRPRSPKEEMQDYINEVYARALGGERAQMLRTGKAEIDMDNDDWDDDDDSFDAPMSVHQMQNMVDILQQDLVRKQELMDKLKAPKESVDGSVVSADEETEEIATNK